MDLRITGADQMLDVGKRLRAAGEQGKGLRKQMTAEIRDAAKPIYPKIKASAASRLSQRGGLARRVARSRISTKVRMGGRSVGVRIVGTNAYQIAAMNRGRLRHPVYGNRSVWVTQKIKPGWFSDPIKAEARSLQRAALKAVEKVGRQVEGK